MEGLGRWYLCTKLTDETFSADCQHTPNFMAVAYPHIGGVAKNSTGWLPGAARRRGAPTTV